MTTDKVPAWGPSEWQKIVPALGEFKRSEVGTKAVQAISELLGYEVTYSTLKHRMHANGMDSPGKYAKGKRFDDLKPLPTSEAGIYALSSKEWKREPEPTADRFWVDPGPEPLPKGPVDAAVERIACFGDIHAPWEDKIAFPLAVRAAKEFRADTVVLMGDMADFASVSFHDRDPSRLHNLLDEVTEVNKVLDQIGSIGAKRVIAIEGNHCFRLRRYIAQKCPELDGLFSVEKLFKIAERGWEWVNYRDHIKIGSMYFTHECGYAGSTSAARSRDAYNGNICVGHSHNATITYRSDAKGDPHVGFSVGWLGDAKAATYCHAIQLRNWQHGLGLIYSERATGHAHCHFAPIVEGKICIEGKLLVAGEVRNAA
jgi:hypothetical protein